MIKQGDFDFLAGLMARQDAASPRMRPIPRARLEALARDPTGMTEAEMTSLLLSPDARANFAAARQAANDDRYILRVVGLAAADGVDAAFTLAAGLTTLTIEPGPHEAAPYLLALQLDPAVPGGVAGRRVTLRHSTSKLLWLEGCTDAEGAIHAVWAHPGVQPRDNAMTEGLRLELDTEPGP